MSIFHKVNSQQSESGVGRPSADGVTRLIRIVGRVLLWGFVLSLLVRGIASYFGDDSRPAPTPRGTTVTVTQPAGAGPSNTQGK